MLPWNELPEPPDSTCAQVIHSRPEAQSANWVPTIATREYQDEEDDQGTMVILKGEYCVLANLVNLLAQGPNDIICLNKNDLENIMSIQLNST